MENKKLYRSSTNYKLAGVCGGIGEYFGIDPVIVRIALVVLTFLGFSGVLAYIIAIFIIPNQPVVKMNVQQETNTNYDGTPTYTTVTKNVVESEAVVTESEPSDKGEN